MGNGKFLYKVNMRYLGRTQRKSTYGVIKKSRSKNEGGGSRVLIITSKAWANSKRTKQGIRYLPK